MIVVWASTTPPLGHHLHEIAKAELEPEMPVDTKDNDLPVDMTTLEKVIYALHPGSLSPNDEFASNTPRLNRWRQGFLTR